MRFARGRALVAVLAVTACSAGATSGRASQAPGLTSPSSASIVESPATTQTSPTKVPRPSTASSVHHQPAQASQALPLGLPTSTATEVITVTAASMSSTTAALRAWERSGGGWRAVGPPVPAWLGSAGLTMRASESSTATPIGSFTLTQAFGHDADPGTALPYTRTTPDDWWISQPGPLYNTRQRCSSGCPFTRGAPNEHLYDELPYYDYAVVIDYNTADAPGGTKPGAGSAFFLHVTVRAPTQGCVSIPADQLIRLLRWLRPSAHPRILIGTGRP